MDLKPLYELRERLKSGAVAGAGLAAEDFRLARAVEAMAPLAAASPVFSRLAALVRYFLSPECTDRAGALLDAVTLADAILCTQGAVAAEGPAEPLRPIGEGTVVTGAPYSVLAPLLDALTSSGSGKYSFVLNTHKEHPELFKDYRVKEAMVRALGASFSELADQVEEWLSAEDTGLLPLLEYGFDPRGKREMVRRVRVIEAIAGSDADEFYLSRLPEAEKEVRQELIYALRYSESNTQHLTELCRTEKGSSRKAAHWALARLESPDAWKYWEEMAAKKPGQVSEYMVLSRARGASVLIARLIGLWLEPFEAESTAPLTRASVDLLNGLLAALPGKSGAEICDIYRRMADLGTALDRPLDEATEAQTEKQEKKQTKRQGEKQAGKQKDRQTAVFQCWYGIYERVEALPFSQAVPMVLKQSVIVNPAQELLSLAMELGIGCLDGQQAIMDTALQSTTAAARRVFAAAGLTALLISGPADRAFLAAESYMDRKGIFKKKVKEEDLAVLADAIRGVCWDEDSNTQTYRICLADPENGRRRYFVCPLRQQMDRRWYERLASMGGSQEVDALLTAMICPKDKELCALIGEYFYKRALAQSDSHPYLECLCRCGWTECENLAVHYCLSRDKVSSWELSSFIYAMPGDSQARAQEAERVLVLIEKDQIKYTNGNPAVLRQMILDLRNSDSIVL